jgi:hypothetical protein
MMNDALPSGWRPADQPDDTMTRYNPQPVTQYEHAETDVGVQLIPIDPQSGSEAKTGYRINVLGASTDNASEIDLLTTAPNHEAALDIARRFMRLYNDRYVDDTASLTTIMSEFSGTD